MPDVLIIDIGTNNITFTRPEVLVSLIDDLLCFILKEYSVQIIGVSHIVPHGAAFVEADLFFFRRQKF